MTVSGVLIDFNSKPISIDSFYLKYTHIGPVFVILAAVLFKVTIADYLVPEGESVHGLDIAGREGVPQGSLENQHHEILVRIVTLKIEALEITVLPSGIAPCVIRGALFQEPIVVNWPERKGLCTYNNRKD